MSQLPHWDDLPDYQHTRYCQWSHVQKCCPSGCNGEPVEYPDTVENQTPIEGVGGLFR